MAYVPGDPIFISQGDTPTIVFVIAVEDGLPFDPTQAAGVIIAAKSSSAANPSADIIFQKSTADGSASFDTMNGAPVLKATLAQTDTNDVAAGKYYYEALILEASGTIRSHVAKGPFSILQSVGK